MNCCVRPLAMDGLAGVTAMLLSVAAVTVSTVLPLTTPLVAVMVLVPMATPVALPFASMVAAAGVPLVQVTWVVISAVGPKEKLPVAVNCCVVPAAIDTVGVTAIPVSVAA